MSGYSVALSLNEIREAAAKRYPEYLCPKCSLLLSKAVQTNCGHLLCESCAEQIFRSRSKSINCRRCPNKHCGENLLGDDGTKYFPDRRLRKEIHSLPLPCPIKGCPWEGTLNDYEVHYFNQHPPNTLQAVPENIATHALVEIKQAEMTKTVSQVMRASAEELRQNAANLEREAHKLEEQQRSATYLHRGSADSMHRLMSASGGAHSTKSLGRACQEFPEEKSSTLKAQGSDQEHVKFEISSDFEHGEPIPQTPRRTNPEMVTGSSSSISTRPQPIMRSVMEQNQSPTSQHTSPSVACLPPLISPENKQVHDASSRVMTALSVNPQRRLRRNSPHNPLPSLPLTQQPPSQSPSKYLPGPANRGKSSKRSAKANTLPQLEIECFTCKERKKTVEEIKYMFSWAMKEGIMKKCPDCQKKDCLRLNSL